MSNFMIDGVIVKAPDLGAPLHQLNQVSISYNNADATMINIPKANKDKFLWSYAYIHNDDLKVIEDIINAKWSQGINKFTITSYVPVRGWVTKECYLGATIDHIPVSAYGGIPTAWKSEFHWIQIKGQLQL